MKTRLMQSLAGLSGLLLTCCDPSGGGLQQRLAEAEAQRDARSARVTDLEKQVAELEQRAAAANKVTEDSVRSDSAVVAAQAEMMGKDVEPLVKPSSLKVYGQVIFTGFMLEKADGSFTGVSVPFFGDGKGGWRCGLSKEQISGALAGKAPTSQPTQAAAPSSNPPLPGTPERVTAPNPPPATISESGRKVIKLGEDPPPVPDWLRQKASPGSRLVFTPGNPDEDELPVWREIKADGTIKLHMTVPQQ